MTRPSVPSIGLQYPSDWLSISVGQIGEVIRGASPRPKGNPKFYGGPVPRLMVEDVTRDGKFVTPSVDSLTLEGARLSRFCSTGTLTIVCSGTVGIPSFLAVDACIHDGFLAITNISKDVDSDYLYHQFVRIRAEFETSATHGGVFTNLTTFGVRNLNLRLPPTKVEQQRIARALSDADTYLESLEKLIEKKQMIKQGVMQALLIDKARLPGFTGDWQERRLGDSSMLKARIGWQGLTTAEYRDAGDYGLVTGTELIEGKVAWDKCHFVEEQRYKQDKYIQLRKGDVLVTKDGTIGKVAFVPELPFPATLNSGVFVIRPKDQMYDPQFLFYLLRSRVFVDFLEQLSAGSTINHLYQKDFVNFVFQVPPTKNEQRAIANLLSDVDEELLALDAKLAKARNIKQGMAQLLLTGKIRLIQKRAIVKQVVKPTAGEFPATLFDPHDFEVSIRTRNEHNENVVMLSAIADELGTNERPLGNKRCMKVVYLVRRYTKMGTEGFLKLPAGPSNPAINHEARTRAVEKQYVSEVTKFYKGKDYSGIVSGQNSKQVAAIFDEWFGSATRSWIRMLKFKSTDELECLATVDFAILELRKQGVIITVGSVESFIRQEPEWTSKLQRNAFSKMKISGAIDLSNMLFGEIAL